jgi:antitoxin MazE
MVRGKLVNMGNSRGIILAKPLLEVAGLADEVDIEAAPGVLTIRPSAHPRAGWAEAAAACDPEGLLDATGSTRFDDKEWSW